MTTHLIITVGTSIIGNYNNSDFCKSGPGNRLNLTSGPSLGHRREFDYKTFPPPDMLCGNYDAARPVLTDDRFEGAEQSSIREVMTIRKMKKETGCHYHLLVTRTESCIFCASFLGHEYLPKDKVTYYTAPGFGKADRKRFSTVGLPNLLACVAAILDRAEERGDDSIIIPTGGFKIVTPYLTIASILYKRPAYYIYEASRTLLEFPAPPLSVDGAALRSVLVLLENIIGLNMTEAGPYFNALPSGFRDLIYINDRDVFSYTAFGERLRKMFMDQAGVSPLAARASENSLIPFLKDYQEKYQQMAGLGETVWTGDKAPEMADHARHHHTNLFAYTELLLLPVFSRSDPFLKPEELFLFLGMVYLHDCGHSLCAIPGKDGENIPLLPTEIRNFHNLLGYYRLCSAEFHEILERQGIAVHPDDLKAIAELSVYHRKKMPLISGSCQAPDGGSFGPLKKKKEVIINNQMIPGDSLALLISLFRIIDGMDKQLGRAGDAIEITMKAESVLADIPYLWDKVKCMESAMNRKGFKKARKIADGFFKEIVEDYGLKESAAAKTGTPSVSGKKCRGCLSTECSAIRSPGVFTEEPVYLRLRKKLSGNKIEECLPFAWEYLESRVRFFFQALQPTYYYTDLLLGMPRVSHRLEGGVRHITIQYPLNRDISGSQEKIQNVWHKICLWIEDRLPDDALEKRVLMAELADPMQVVGGIRDEYCGRKNSEVASILKEAGIIIQFKCGEEDAECWK